MDSLMKKLRVLVLMHPEVVPPDDLRGFSQKEMNEWKTEYDIVSTLRAIGHEVTPLGVQHELLPIREAVENWRPHIIFNLLEEFQGEAVYDQHVVGYLELLKVPYTGCNPRGLVLSRGKALAKKMLAYHRIRVPGFDVFPRGRRVRKPRHTEAVENWRPHIIFNLLEEFQGEAVYDQHVVGYLELLKVPYTGCNPRGLVLSRGKALAKKMLAYHRIRVPGFAVFPRGRRVRKPRRLKFPVIVKSLMEHSSLGISQASVVDSEEKLVDRVSFIHNNICTDAIAEEYIDGRELYVGVLGNQRLQVFPTWELVFRKKAESSLPIATARAKHNIDYQKLRGINHRFATGISEDLGKNITHNSKRIYRTLELDGYARIDYRLTADGKLFFLEANANPDLAEDEEFSSSAAHIGITFEDLLQKILNLGIRRGN